MDFQLDPDLDALRRRVRTLVDDAVIPLERELFEEDAQGEDAKLKALQAQMKNEGLWTPHLPKDHGGQGLGVMGMCALFREMGRSIFGAKAFNCDAPNQGNMDLLLRVATEEQKQRYLQPLAAGEITSAFAMTEPAPGAGADPRNLKTTAKRTDKGWVLNGRKWYTTGGGRAAFLILMARTSDDPKHGASMFLVDRNAPGINHVRDIEVMAPPLLDHREAEFLFEDVELEADAVLGGEGQGFVLAQERLVPARLTHCMRWLGLAERALSECKEYITTRKSFGKELARHQLIQQMVARAAAGIHSGNLMTWHCASLLAQGQANAARPYSSMAKNHVAQLLCQVLDDAIQMHGGLGYSYDAPFAQWYLSARAARIADGPDEVHTMVVARDYLAGRLEVLV